MLGDTIDASGVRIGIANRVLPDEELETTVKEIASQLASRPPITMA